MASYRQMRRHARLARRSRHAAHDGHQAPAGQLPEPAAIHRPVGMAVPLRTRPRVRRRCAAGGRLARRTAAHPAWWPLILAATMPHVALAATLGVRLGLPTIAERLYAATVALAAGGWLAAAVSVGPLARPLLLAAGHRRAGAGRPVVGPRAPARESPRGTHPRRLACHRHGTSGCAGSQVMSATVDLWGWRARLRLARGQTITDVAAKIPAIESGLGTFRGALRVYPTPDDLANRCELRVLNSDPHADAIPWPATPVTSITQPVDLGPFEDAEPCRVLFLRRHALLAGTTGSGKSGGLNVLMANLSACCDMVIWAIDLKQGMELGPVGIVHRPARHHPRASRRAAARRGRDPARPRRSAGRHAAAAPGNRHPACPRAGHHHRRVRRTGRRRPGCDRRRRHHRPAGPRGRRDAGRRHPAAHPAGHGRRRSPLPDGHSASASASGNAATSTWSWDRACSPPDGTPTS